MPLTHNPSPIHIAGKPFPEWREAGHAGMRSALLEVTTDDVAASEFLGLLGQSVPGLLEDGTAVEFYISTVQWVAGNRHVIQIIPSVSQAWGDLL